MRTAEEDGEEARESRQKCIIGDRQRGGLCAVFGKEAGLERFVVVIGLEVGFQLMRPNGWRILDRKGRLEMGL